MSEWCAVCKQPLRYDLPRCTACGRPMEMCLGLGAPAPSDPVFSTMKRFAEQLRWWQLHAFRAVALLPN